MAQWFMYMGKVVEYGPADAIFAGPNHPYTRALPAASPKPDPDARYPEIVLGATMPEVSDVSSGCVFLKRCPRRIDGVCDKPVPLQKFDEHLIYCHLNFLPGHHATDAT